MIGFNHNDGGRAEAGFRGNARDCVCRAISIITGGGGTNYKKWYKLLADMNRKRCGKATAREGLDWKDSDKAMVLAGLTKVKRSQGDPYPTFTEAYERYGDCIVTTTGHICAIVDGKLQDNGDIRTYVWDEYGTDDPETRERKARSVWVPTESS